MGLLSQALKNFFPLNKGDNDFTSSCKIPYFNASNNPYGCVSPSKLASVLGGLLKVKVLFSRRNGIWEESFAGYGLYILQEGGGTGDCVIFTVNVESGGIHIISDSSNLVGRYYALSKISTGGNFTISSITNTWSSLMVLSPNGV